MFCIRLLKSQLFVECSYIPLGCQCITDNYLIFFWKKYLLSLFCIFYIAVKYYQAYILTSAPPHLQLWLKVRGSLYSNQHMFKFFFVVLKYQETDFALRSSVVLFYSDFFFSRVNKVLIFVYYTCLKINLILATFWTNRLLIFLSMQNVFMDLQWGAALRKNLDRISDDEMFTAVDSFCRAFRTDSKCIHDCRLLIG